LELLDDTTPIISYNDNINNDLKLAECNDPNCTGGDEALIVVDSAGDVGDSNSLRIARGPGSPVISYHDQGSDNHSNNLKFARLPPLRPALRIPRRDFFGPRVRLFFWQPVFTATSYDFQADGDSSFANPDVEEKDLPSTKLKLLKSLPYGQYYWHTRAGVKGGGWTPWSDVGSFQVTLLKSPLNGKTFNAGAPLSFKWAADWMFKAKDYRLEVDDDPQFKSVDFSVLTKSRAVKLSITKPGKWYWRVVPVVGDIDQATNMPIWEFAITP
jgi:hypothetical protein